MDNLNCPGDAAKLTGTGVNTNEYPHDSTWLQEFELLVCRYSDLGITPDISSLSLIECYGLFKFLRGIHENVL